MDLRYTQVDSRETARIWIHQNLPWSARVAIERYTPFLNEKQFIILVVESLTDHPPEWYVAHQVNCLVFSKGIFQRYEENPELYSEKVQAYERLFKQFKLIKTFDDGGYEIRIYEAKPMTP